MKNIKNMLKLWLCLLVAILVGCASVPGQIAYEYQTGMGIKLFYVKEVGDTCWIQLNDRISTELVDVFKQAANDLSARPCANKWIVLNSLGGNVAASFAVGRIIREKRFNTILPRYGGFCASACGMLFIAGVKREAQDRAITGSHLGFHQYTNGGACVKPSNKEYRELHNYAAQLLPADAAALFVKLVIGTGCNQMDSSVSLPMLKEAGIITGDGALD